MSLEDGSEAGLRDGDWCGVAVDVVNRAALTSDASPVSIPLVAYHTCDLTARRVAFRMMAVFK